MPPLQPMAAPHCEVGCAASLLHRLGVDMQTEVVGSEWAFETAIKHLSTVPQRFIDRTDVAVSAQGRGWREAADCVAGVRTADHRVERGEYLSALRAALAVGGALLLVDDFAVPWLDYSGASHGLLPHALALSGDDTEAGEVVVVEGHAWWCGTYRLSYPQLLAAAFPDEDTHRIAGRFLAFTATEVAPERRTRQARAALRQSCARHRSGPLTVDETPFGTFTVAPGPEAGPLAVEALRSFGYVCRLAEDASGDRDAAIGGYLFLRMADELGFAAYARRGTERLLASTGADETLRSAVDEVAGRWRVAWLAARDLAAHPRVTALENLLEALAVAATLDLGVAGRIADDG